MPTAFISGASRGIGRAAALKLASLGYDLALNYHTNYEAAQNVQHEAQKYGVKVLLLAGDIADENNVREMFRKIGETFGGADVVVNNASFAEQLMFQDITYEKWRRMFAVTVDGAFFTVQNALPHMLHEKCGRIINISSMWGEVGASCEVHYSAAKGALIAMTKALAKELGPSGITVNCITPGVIDTDMNAHLSAEDLAELCEETPLGRLGSPDDIAETVAFLASAEAGFITGQIIGVNGGFVI
ncbi:MAG: 3-oxoacyl-ACP reductase [Clostridiales bacterium]|nr:MAG: 3-oxoacyl-ACP reductase [Clostridiales bacterium]